MMRFKTVSMLLFCFSLATFAGCLWAPDLDRVRQEIEDQLPGAHFKKEFAISLGPVSIGFARMVVSMVPDAKEARPYLKDIRRVKVAIYEAEHIPNDVKLEVPDNLSKLLKRDDWELAVKVRDNGENVWVLYQTKKDDIKALYVVVLDHDELVLVKAEGRLHRLFEKVMEDHVDWREIRNGT